MKMQSYHADRITAFLGILAVLVIVVAGGAHVASGQNSIPTTTVVICSPNPSNFGQSVTCTAKVTLNVLSMSDPTGTIDFYDGADLLAAGVALGGSPPQAAFTTATFSPGAHTIIANYSGDNVFEASSGNTIQQVLNSVGVPTMNEWGIITFVLLAGLSSLYYLRRRV